MRLSELSNEDMKAFGRLLGEVIAKKDTSPSVNVHVPSVEVSVDADPLAAAMREGAQENANAILGAIQLLVSSVGEKLGESVVAMAGEIPGQADLTGVEDGLLALTNALSDETAIAGLDTIVRAIDAQTRAIDALAKAQDRNTAAIRADRTPSYDSDGRISKIKVGA